MLDTILKAAQAPALLAGAWVTEGPSADRIGPYTRTVVSRARVCDAADVTAATRHAARAAKVVARLAPATRAGVLETAARLAGDRRADFARLIALELGKPVKDGLG
jgi:acyl-CoA reductase-like NAD-dependent aldehyde dehydrogenase